MLRFLSDNPGSGDRRDIKANRVPLDKHPETDHFGRLTVEVCPVSDFWRAFRRFWSAEEVPRWFGLSLVLVYLIGLGSVAYFGISEARTAGEGERAAAVQYSLELLAREIAEQRLASSAPVFLARTTELLTDFSRSVDARLVRLTGATGEVLAMAQRGFIDVPQNGGSMANPLRDPAGSSASRLRVAVPRLSQPVSTGSEASATAPIEPQDALFIEAILAKASGGSYSLAEQARLLTVVLVVLGTLLLLYRRLRDQMRPVTHIAERLTSNSERLREQISALRLTDSTSTISQAWNDLVEFTSSLADSVKRTKANEELTAVLKQSAGGAIHEALHALPDALIHITDEVRIAYSNTAACHLMGWKSSDIDKHSLPEVKAQGVGSKVLELIRDALTSSGAYESRTAVLETGESSSTDASTYRAWLFPVTRANHHGECLVLVRDVSQQIRAERAREEFVTQVTHELRTPLTNIRAYAETLSSGMFDDPKVITECYNVITKETRRLSRLIEDVLSVSQFEVGSLDLRIDMVDLKTLLTESVRDVRGLADDKGIDVQLVLPAKLEPIKADRDKLAVVINNLLGNAIKYTKKDGNVVLGCQYSADYAVITVKDNGIGVDPADHQRIFEKFQRGTDPDALNETGTGIGLYTAREIVRGHGGDIELISQKGQGSTFMVRIPFQASRATPLTTAEEA